MLNILIKIFIFILGLVVGSFLNVCIYRMSREISIRKPKRSFCPHCKKTIPWYDNIPVLSFILLKARCRFCSGKISWQYPVVELLTGIMFLILYNYFGLSWALVVYAIFIAGLIIATFTDIEKREIPDQISIGGMIVGLIFGFFGFVPNNGLLQLSPILVSIFGSLVGIGVYCLAGIVFYYFRQEDVDESKIPERRGIHSKIFERILLIFAAILGWNLFPFIVPLLNNVPLHVVSFFNALIGATIGASVLYIFGDFGDFLFFELGDFLSRKLFKKEIYLKEQFAEGEEPTTMGGGDIKLLAMIGAFLGWQNAIVTLFLSCILAGITGIIIKIKTKGSLIAFGPFIVVAAVIALFFGEQIIEIFTKTFIYY